MCRRYAKAARSRNRLKFRRLCIVPMTAMFLASCGGGGNDSQSAEDIYRQTGKSAFVGDFEITNFTISPNPVVAGQNLRISYLVHRVNELAPAEFVSMDRRTSI